jgi:4-hydroxybenzoate polyprenyltransferase
MEKLWAYFRLFRWKNLLMILLAQMLFRYAIAGPVFWEMGMELPLHKVWFLLLVLSTLMISAAGYAINDYFDLRADRINKPDMLIIGRILDRRDAILAHKLLNVAGVLIGLALAFHVRSYLLLLAFLLIPAALWLYSIRWKRSLLVGNIMVALLAAMVTGIVWYTEQRAAQLFTDTDMAGLSHMGVMALFYSLFAFTTNLVREIFKDVQDLRGDAASGARTFPVVAGVRKTVWLATVLLILNVVLIGMFSFWLEARSLIVPVVYLGVAVQIPLLLMIPASRVARTSDRFGKLQRYMKWIMLIGLLSMLFVSL